MGRAPHESMRASTFALWLIATCRMPRIASALILLDARGVDAAKFIAQRAPIDGVLSNALPAEDDWYCLRGGDIRRGGGVVGRAINVAGDARGARNDILAVVRGGAYNVLLLDGACDASLLDFALARAAHCRGISGVDVAVVQSVRDAADVDAVAAVRARLAAGAPPPDVCVAAEVDEAWAIARSLLGS